MAFPLTLDGTVRVKIPEGCAIPVEVAVDGLATALKKVKASTIQQQESSVVFTVNFLRLVWNLNILIPFEGGRIDVRREAETVRVTYRLGTYRLFFLASALTFAMAMIPLSKADLAMAAGALALGLGWLFGANYLIALVRFRWFASGKVRDAFDDWVELSRTI